MRKRTSKSKTVRTGLAIILVLLLIFGSALSTLAAPKHDNFNETARDAVKRAGGKGIENSNNPNSALHGNGDQEEVVVEEDESEEVEKEDEENDKTKENDGEENKKNPVKEIDEDNENVNDVEEDEKKEEAVVVPDDNNNEDDDDDERLLEDEEDTEQATGENSNTDNTQNSNSQENPGQIIEIQALQIPEGQVDLDNITITDKEIPQSAPDLNRVIVLDEEVPQSAPSLPQTGDANPLFMVITGLGMAASGLSIRRRQKFTTSSVTTLFQDK